MLGKTDPKIFWGVTADAKSVAAFIRLWLTEHGRWNAPKFLGGESYGTTRGAALALSAACIASSQGRASATPVPLRNVRRESVRRVVKVTFFMAGITCGGRGGFE